MLVFLSASLQRNNEFYRSALENAGHEVIAESSSRPPVGDSVAALMTTDAAHNQLAQLRKQFARVFPVLIGDTASFVDSSDLTLASAPTLSRHASVEELMRMIDLVSRGNGWLLRELIRIDEIAKQVVGDEMCEWVRCRDGIIGLLRFAYIEPSLHATNLLRRSIEYSYALLDNLPRQKFSLQDVWNVTLIVAVPVKKAEFNRNPTLFRPLDGLSQDLTGARKIVMYLDEGIHEYFGPLSLSHTLSELSATDPLREALTRLAVDSTERDALEAIFKSRLSQEDIDRLTQVLGRPS